MDNIKIDPNAIMFEKINWILLATNEALQTCFVTYDNEDGELFGQYSGQGYAPCKWICERTVPVQNITVY
jgi:hypothetical protein